MTNPTTPPPYNEWEQHYNSLIKLFNSALTKMIVLITFVGAVIGYITFTNGQEMRAAMNKEKVDLKDEIKEMKIELREQQDQLNTKEKNMETKLLSLIDKTNEEIHLTKKEALEEIIRIENVARTEAKDKIDEVFKEKNLDHYVEKRVEEIVEPKVKEEIEKINAKEKSKTDNAIVGLHEGYGKRFESSIEYFKSNPSIEFSNQQAEEIINIIKNTKDGRIKRELIDILPYRKSKKADEFLVSCLLSTKDYPSLTYNNDILKYVFDQDLVDLDFCKHLIENQRDENSKYSKFMSLIRNTLPNKKSMTISILNSKEIVDLILTPANQNMWDQKRIAIKNTINAFGQIDSEELTNTYFNTKK